MEGGCSVLYRVYTDDGFVERPFLEKISTCARRIKQKTVKLLPRNIPFQHLPRSRKRTYHSQRVLSSTLPLIWISLNHTFCQSRTNDLGLMKLVPVPTTVYPFSSRILITQVAMKPDAPVTSTFAGDWIVGIIKSCMQRRDH